MTRKAKKTPSNKLIASSPKITLKKRAFSIMEASAVASGVLPRKKQKIVHSNHSKESPIPKRSKPSSSSLSASRPTPPTKKKRRVKPLKEKEKVSVEEITVHRMVSRQFEGFKIQWNKKPAGYVKFFSKNNPPSSGQTMHATVDFKIPQPLRGKHIGRLALEKAIQLSSHTRFMAHLSKKNIASKKALTAVGFKEYQTSPQLMMEYIRSGSKPPKRTE